MSSDSYTYCGKINAVKSRYIYEFNMKKNNENQNLELCIQKLDVKEQPDKWISLDFINPQDKVIGLIGIRQIIDTDYEVIKLNEREHDARFLLLTNDNSS